VRTGQQAPKRIMSGAIWREIDPEAARASLDAAGAVPLEQSWAYAMGFAESGAGRVKFFAAADRAVTVLHARRWWGLWPALEVMRGPVFRDPTLPVPERVALTRAMLGEILPLRRLGFAFWTPDPDQAEIVPQVLGGGGMARVFTGHATSRIDLRRPLPALRAALHGKWRNALVTAERRGTLRLRIGADMGAIGETLARYEALRRARRFAGPSAAQLRAAVMRAPRAHVLSVTAESDRGAASGALFLRHGREATWVAGWATAEARREGGHCRALWHGLRTLRDAGLERLDLGGVDTAGAPGIARFKLGLGGDLVVFPGTWGR
jgi:hypothetical protein